jgi:hypothetical protein
MFLVVDDVRERTGLEPLPLHEMLATLLTLPGNANGLIVAETTDDFIDAISYVGQWCLDHGVHFNAHSDNPIEFDGRCIYLASATSHRSKVRNLRPAVYARY